MSQIVSKALPYHHPNHPHFFDFQYEHQNHDSNLSSLNLVNQGMVFLENEILLSYYKWNSIYPIMEFIWENITNVNLLLSIQELVAIILLLSIGLFYILEDYTSFPIQQKPMSNVEIAPENNESPLMLHRYHNSKYRHKKNLPDEHYFIHYRKFRYEIEEIDDMIELDNITPTDILKDKNLVKLQTPYLSIVCMVIGLTVLVRFE